MVPLLKIDLLLSTYITVRFVHKSFNRALRPIFSGELQLTTYFLKLLNGLFSSVFLTTLCGIKLRNIIFS